jgi:hypothetical protein
MSSVLGKTRTCDPPVRNRLLFPLSYEDDGAPGRTRTCIDLGLSQRVYLFRHGSERREKLLEIGHGVWPDKNDNRFSDSANLSVDSVGVKHLDLNVKIKRGQVEIQVAGVTGIPLGARKAQASAPKQCGHLFFKRACHVIFATLALSGCASNTPVLDNAFCRLYQRLPDPSDAVNLKLRANKVAILTNEQAYIDFCQGKKDFGGPR